MFSGLYIKSSPETFSLYVVVPQRALRNCSTEECIGTGKCVCVRNLTFDGDGKELAECILEKKSWLWDFDPVFHDSKDRSKRLKTYVVMPLKGLSVDPGLVGHKF